MRIALVSQEYPPETANGGIGSQTYIKAHGLASMGHEVFVISYSKDQHKHEYRDGDVNVIRIPGFDTRLLIYNEPARWITYSAEVSCAISELHSRTTLDILDFPDWGCEGYVYLLNRTGFNYIPTVIHLHSPLIMFAHTINWPEPNSVFYNVGTAMEETCLKLADAIFSSSKCSAEWCRSHYNLDDQKIPIIHTGIDTKLFQPLDIPKNDRPTIIFVGKIAPNKGVDILVEASCHLANEYPDLKVRLIGKGDKDFIKKLKEIELSYGFSDLLELPGYINQKDLPTELSRAHVFTAPSIYEGGPGFVYLEAMACGLPVIGCEGSGVSEIITNDVNGLLVPPEDVQALENALCLILTDPVKREAMGRQALNYAQEEADSRKNLLRIEAFYKCVINHPISNKNLEGRKINLLHQI